MEYKVVLTKQITSSFRVLEKAGKKGKDAIRKTRAAATEASTEGEIKDLKRTNHGESRLPNIEKFDLGDGYRLVVQLVDGVKKTRAFLFVGTHDEAEEWLENHRNYRFVKNERDNSIEFVRCTTSEEVAKFTYSVDTSTAEKDLSLPLLRSGFSDRIDKLPLSEEAKTFISGVTIDQWESDPDAIFEKVLSYSNSDDDLANCLLDVLQICHDKEEHKLQHRINLFLGEASFVKESEFANLVSQPQNSEQFITWDDVDDYFKSNPDGDWQDWMLFLHPEQKVLVDKEFSGPVRLRGVSGSGKTTVLIHRARCLARKYREPILILTLTESVRKLIEQLFDRLCGVERQLIVVQTIQSFAKQCALGIGKLSHEPYIATNREINEYIQGRSDRVYLRKEFSGTQFQSFSKSERIKFLREEFQFVRSRLTKDNYSEYLNPGFKRVGRKIPLQQEMRKLILEEIIAYEEELVKASSWDFEGIIQKAISSLRQPDAHYRKVDYRAILVDEVQDLSQNEIVMIADYPRKQFKKLAELPDAIFLVGDGAQSVHKKGFSLQSSGLQVKGRSFTFLKNFRNTREILKSAYKLIEDFEYADIDEDSIAKPVKPEFATRRGEKPYLVKCINPEEEANFVVEQIKAMSDVLEISQGNICIIGLSQDDRERIRQALNSAKIDVSELRNDVDNENSRVKLSTVESAKGHEFDSVFIVGVNAALIPKATEDISHEASRMYIAMTRACNHLFVSYNTPSQPSIFLSSIIEFCDEYQYRNGALRPIS